LLLDDGRCQERVESAFDGRNKDSGVALNGPVSLLHALALLSCSDQPQNKREGEPHKGLLASWLDHFCLLIQSTARSAAAGVPDIWLVLLQWLVRMMLPGRILGKRHPATIA